MAGRSGVYKEADVKLTAKEFAFADAILRGLNNIEAAEAAGLKGNRNSLAVAAQRLYANGNIQKYISLELQIREAERRKKIEVDDLWITEQFKEIYNRCMQRIPVMRYDRDAGQMVQETNEAGEGVWTFDSSGANRALENIAKHIGYYEIDNRQRQTVIQVNIQRNTSINVQGANTNEE